MKNIISTFQKVVAENSDKYAIIEEENFLTYDELDILSDKICKYLEDNILEDNKCENIIGIHMKKSSLYIATILAVLKSGNAFLPLDIRMPIKRKKYILNNCNTKVLLSDENESVISFNSDCSIKKVMNIKEKLSKINSKYSRGVVRQITNTNLAYVIYTSGSTGNPKGTLLEHKGLVNLKKLWKNTFKINSNDRVLFFSNISFDASIWEIFMALFCGARLYIPNDDVINNFSLFNNFVMEKAITVVTLPPSYAAYLEFNKMKSIRLLISEGEQVNNKLIEKLKDTSITFINAYGPTEATICSTVWIYSENEIIKNIPIGKAIKNVRSYIMNEDNEISDSNTEGELVIGGAGIARGYLKNDELNNKVFINDRKLGRLYRTGDIVEINKNGNLVFKGRKDNQVKINGQRVEIDEIKRAFTKIQDIREIEIIINNNRLVSFYTTFSLKPVENIEYVLKKTLPDYMVPKKNICIEKMPLTINCKVDKKELLRISDTHKNIKSERQLNEIEKIQLQIWKDVFKTNTISAEDDFFDLGGDSIKAIQIVAKLYEKNYILNTRDILEKRKIYLISEYVKEISNSTDVNDIGQVELNPIQKWFFNQKFNKQNQWNQSLLFSSLNGYSEEIVLKVMNKLIKYHNVLRSIFKEVNGEYRQQIVEYIERKDLVDHIYIDENKEGILDDTLEQCQECLDITKGNVIKAWIITAKDNEYLFINLHHLVSDGISLRIIQDDFINLYLSIKNNKEIVVPKKTVSYKVWNENIKKLADNISIKKDFDFWSNIDKTLADVRMFGEYEDSNLHGLILKRGFLSEEKTSLLLKEANKAFNTKINDLLLSALALMFNQVLDKHMCAFNLETYGRFSEVMNLNVARTVGWFTVQYPVILQVHSDDVDDVIFSVKDQLAKIPNKGMSYGVLKEENPDKFIYDKNLQVNFNYLGDIDFEENDDQFLINEDRFPDAFGPDGYGNLNLLDKDYFKLNITSYVFKKKFCVCFSMSKKVINNEKLADMLSIKYIENLNEIIDTCMNKTKPIKTFSDFSLDNFNEDKLKDILKQI